MSRAPIPRSDTALMTLSPGVYRDPNTVGLTLHISPRTRSRSWVLRYTDPTGRRRDMHLDGGLPVVHVRRRVAQARYLLAVGRDPLAIRRNATRQTPQSGEVWTFGRSADCCIRDLSPRWKNPKHCAQWVSTLATHAKPLTALPVADIGVDQVKRVLTAIWSSRPETARRLASRIKAVLGWAVVHGHRPAGPCPVDLVRPFLGRTKSLVVHHEAVPVEQAPAFWRWLGGHSGSGWQAIGLLRVTLLTGCRSGEARTMRWRDIDWDRDVWSVPAAATKSGRPLDRPLTPALRAELLHAMLRCDQMGISSPDALVYASPASQPGATPRAMTSDGLVRVMRHYGIGRPHGLRSTYLDWARTHGEPEELARLQMGHLIGDATRRAYARDTLLEQRRELMTRWEQYLAG